MDKNNLLITGDVYSNAQIMEIFRVSNSGGIRFSTKTRSLVIFSFHQSVNQKDVPYQDSWEKDTLHYTGQGKEGDQELTRNNKKIVEANQDNITIHLFESFVSREYIYRGIVYLSNNPYKVSELDANHNYRLVYKFPLTIKNGNGELPLSIIQSHTIQQDKNLQKLPQSKLAEMAQEISRSNHEFHKNNPNDKASSRFVNTISFERSPYIANYVKRIANGYCSLCEQLAPFLDKYNQPFLHAHHINYLSDGGEDTIENCIAVCPNCHAKIHALNDPKDREILLNKVRNR